MKSGSIEGYFEEFATFIVLAPKTYYSCAFLNISEEEEKMNVFFAQMLPSAVARDNPSVDENNYNFVPSVEMKCIREGSKKRIALLVGF